MATKNASGLLEHRTRVTCHLPVGKPQELLVVREFIKFLEAQRKKPFQLKGFTRSAFAPPAFADYWRAHQRGGYVLESVVLIMIDFDLSLESDEFRERLSAIKTTIQKLYQGHTGIQQDEIYMVAHPIVRMV